MSKAEFITTLDARFKNDGVWVLDEALSYHSEILNRTITVPKGFETDFASVPRLPLAYALYGGEAQEAAVVHDWLYRREPDVTRAQADAVFREAMHVQGKAWYVRWPMWAGVRLFGRLFYHPIEEEEGVLK